MLEPDRRNTINANDHQYAELLQFNCMNNAVFAYDVNSLKFDILYDSKTRNAINHLSSWTRFRICRRNEFGFLELLVQILDQNGSLKTLELELTRSFDWCSFWFCLWKASESCSPGIN